MRTIAATTAVVLAGTALVGCGAKRSTEALCQSVATHQATYDSQRKAKEEQGLSGYLAIGASLESIKTMWSDFPKLHQTRLKMTLKMYPMHGRKFRKTTLASSGLLPSPAKCPTVPH